MLFRKIKFQLQILKLRMIIQMKKMKNKIKQKILNLILKATKIK